MGMHKTVRAAGLLLAMSVMLFLLSGCFSARIHMKINMSGSAEIEVTMSAPRTLLSLGTTASMFDSIKKDLSKDEFTIEDFAADKQVGFTAVKKISSLEKFSSLKLGENMVISDKPIVTLSKHLLTNTYRVSTDFDLAKILGEDLDALARLADIRFALTLPVKPSEHNADAVSDDGKTMEWKLETGTNNIIQVTATAPNTILIIAVIFLPLLGLSAVIILLVRRRRKKQE